MNSPIHRDRFRNPVLKIKRAAASISSNVIGSAGGTEEITDTIIDIVLQIL